MHSLTICFGPTGTVWNLLFKEEAKAKEAYVAIGKSDVTDDYGQTLGTSLGIIHGLLLQDMDQSQLVQVELGVHALRTQARVQQRAVADPALKAAMMTQGPAVLSGGIPGRHFS